MDELIPNNLDHLLSPSMDRRRRLQTLITTSSSRLLPNSSSHQSLLRFISVEKDPLLIRLALRLVSRFSSPALRSFLLRNRADENFSPRIEAEALAALVSVSSPFDDLDLLLSMVSSPVVAVRSLVLDHLSSTLDARRADLVVPLFLDCMADPYPSVRRAALNGLAALFAVGVDEARIEGFYDRAVELFRDRDEFVRSAAVGAVSQWAQMIEANKVEVDERLDLAFVQISSVARDTSVKVRLDAFSALGKLHLVSEVILLQSLSKKFLGVRNGKKAPGLGNGKESKFIVSSAAGIFIHGLEDEFYEVRRVACDSLGKHSIFSLQFADDALNLMMDMVNDDTMAVRLQTLESMFRMASCDRLNAQGKHMHMFLGVLADISTLIRHAARKVLRLMKLPEPDVFFRFSIESLVTNLETYPEDEEDIFCTLFYISKNHGNFAVKYTTEFTEEAKPSCEGELRLDRPRVAAILVLALASSLSSERIIRDVPSGMFYCAVPLLRRISGFLRNVNERDSLLAHLYHFSGLPHLAASSFNDDEISLHPVGSVKDHEKRYDQVDCSLRFMNNEASEILNMKRVAVISQISTPFKEQMLKGASGDEEATHAIKLVLKAVLQTWPFIHSRYMDEVLNTISACEEELEMIGFYMHGSAGTYEFASLYIQVFQLLIKIWEYLQPRKHHVIGVVVLDLMLENLDTKLRSMLYSFQGLSKEEEVHILELKVLSCLLKFSSSGKYSYPMLKQLHTASSLVQRVSEDLSEFAKEVKNFCSQGITDENCSSSNINRLLELFSAQQFVFSGRFKHIQAELQVPGNDSENPLHFIPGLPVGITFQIALYNLTSKDRLWLRMVVEESIQYAFLDLQQLEGCGDVRKCTVNIPYYKTPKTVSFLLKACVGLECPSEDIAPLMRNQGGPKHDLTFLCKEIYVYLVERESIKQFMEIG